MNIVFVSFDRLPEQDNPMRWLDEISFYTGIPESMTRYAKIFSVHCVGVEATCNHNGVEYVFVKQSRLEPLFPARLLRIIQRLNPDAVIVHGFRFLFPLMLLRMLLGSKVRFYIQHHADQPLKFPKSLLMRVMDGFIRSYFFCHRDLAREWIRRRQISSMDKVTQVMEASSFFSPIDKRTARARTGMTGSPAYIWVGRWDNNKDPLTLLHAFDAYLAARPLATLYLAGLEYPPPEPFVWKGNPRVHFLGRVAHDELQTWFSAADFVVSTSHYEGSGISVCEGMSCGCIPILSDIPSFRMMTSDGAVGLLFQTGASGQLLEQLMLSSEMDQYHEREKTLAQFRDQLSFEVIASTMFQAVRE